MRAIEVPFPLRVYLVAIPGIAGALVAGSGAWTLAFVLFGISLGVYIGVMVWWTRRVNAIRRSEGLTSRDLIKPTFPK